MIMTIHHHNQNNCDDGDDLNESASHLGDVNYDVENVMMIMLMMKIIIMMKMVMTTTLMRVARSVRKSE